MDLTKQVLRTIIKEKLIQKGDVVLAGVSGGADSVVLAHLLNQLRIQIGFSLHFAHYNHRLRLSAKRDQVFVEKLADNLRLPIHIGMRKGPIQSLSEDKCRQLRYKFFFQVCDRIKAGSIALAHTQNDLAETVLMRLLRGTGIHGLRGIMVDNKINQKRLIRPLLSVQRVQIEQYLKEYNLDFCHDETNQQTDYLRNKIRLKLLPDLIKNYNPNLPNTLVDLADNSQIDYDYLLVQAQILFKKCAKISNSQIQFHKSTFLKQHVAMQRLILRLAFENLTSNLNQLNYIHIKEAEDMINSRPEGSIVHWPQSVTISSKNQKLILKFRKMSGRS